MVESLGGPPRSCSKGPVGSTYVPVYWVRPTERLYQAWISSSSRPANGSAQLRHS